jgi:hypothetical protein
MPDFRLVPIERPEDAIELSAVSDATALLSIEKMALGNADLWRDGRYSFSAQVSRVGFRTVYRRAPAVAPPSRAFFR